MAVDAKRDERQVIERWDTVFQALTAEPRRQMIVALLEAPPDRELPLPEAANPSYLLMDPEDLYLELRHTHLPLLAAEGYVRWDDDPLVVRRGPNFDEVAVVFESLQSAAERLPDQLVQGCQRLEERRRRS
ncbi:hypothetical protein [Halostella salina]|uniref:hypothetical protein n=1 Tax=Halostella salina TaxID=1547897 RepID=UPI000EF7B6DF|nr:hypothetical protein [Halostella salina]